MDALRRSIEAEKPAAPRGQSGRLEEAGEGVRTADEQSAEGGLRLAAAACGNPL